MTAATDPIEAETHSFASADGYTLNAQLLRSGSLDARLVVINPAMGVPSGFYRRFATALARAGFTAMLWDYRGIGQFKPKSLQGFHATVATWAEDLSAAANWAYEELKPEKLFMVGHSLGGQLAGLMENPERVNGMVTLSAQSGYWRLQGGAQKLAVLLHGYLTLPVLAALWGYAPWKLFRLGEDLPIGVSTQWARWLRHPEYLMSDSSLPLERYRSFTAPIRAYSVDDDNWGTAKSVDAMMSAYPNVERHHLVPSDYGLQSIGHVGFFRAGSQQLWDEAIRWLDGQAS